MIRVGKQGNIYFTTYPLYDVSRQPFVSIAPSFQIHRHVVNNKTENDHPRLFDFGLSILESIEGGSLTKEEAFKHLDELQTSLSIFQDSHPDLIPQIKYSNCVYFSERKKLFLVVNQEIEPNLENKIRTTDLDFVNHMRASLPPGSFSAAFQAIRNHLLLQLLKKTQPPKSKTRKMPSKT